MGFFNDTTAPPQQVDKEHAKKLHAILAAAKRLTNKASFKVWTNEFRLLHKATTVGRVAAVLAWLPENIKGQYTPHINSAASFRKKFTAIEAAMARGPAAKPTTISDAARQVSKERQLFWPGGQAEKEQELQFIQTTMDVWDDMRRRLKLCMEDAYVADNGLDSRLFLWLLQTLSPYTNHVAAGWLEEIHTYALRRQKAGTWQNNMGRYAWHLQHWRIKKFLEVAIYAYCGEARSYAFVMGKLEQCK